MEAPTTAAGLRGGGGLYGRAEELAALEETLDQARTGRRAIALIDGEAGIGKTRLMAAAMESARARGMRVATGTAIELEQTRPFGLVTAALGCVPAAPDPRRAAIAELLAAQVTGSQGTVSSDPGLQFRVVDAITDLVEELALAGPLAIFLDDLQWADPSTLLTLAAVIRRVSYLPVALIGSRRPWPHSSEADRFVAVVESAEPLLLSIGALDEKAVRDLTAEIIAAEPSAQVLSQIARAAGNPLFITELGDALLREGPSGPLDARAPTSHSSLPPTLRLTILRRLSVLPDPTLVALRAASILGTQFSLIQLSVTTSQSALALNTVLADAISAGVLEADGARLRFRHDLIRDAIYQDLPLAVRCALHREAGQRLAAAGGPVQQVAEQLSRGAEPGDADAIDWLSRAARESASTSPEIAADLLGRTIALMAPDDPHHDERIVERAMTLVWAGRMSQATAICEGLLDRTHTPLAEGPARLCLGQALLGVGHVRRALNELERAIRVPSLTGTERASALSSTSVCHIWLADLDAATRAAQEAASVASAAGNHMVIAAATTMIGVTARLRGQLRRSIELCDEAVRLADQSPGRQGHRYPVHAPRGYVLIELDRFAEARATLDTGMRLSKDLGNPWHLANYQMVRAVERYISGEWDDAVAEIETSIELARETGEAYGLVICRGLQAMISLHRNDLLGANEAAAAAARLSTASDARYDAERTLRVQALLLDAEGRSAEAYEVLTGVWDLCTRFGHTLEYRVLGPDLVRLALSAGDRQHASRVCAAVGRLAEQNDLASLNGAALRCRGLVDDDAETLAEAAELYAPQTRPLEWASTCEDAGAAFIRRGDAGRAGPLLEGAAETYRRLGAARDLARAESALRAAGIRHGQRGPRKRPLMGWDSLTATEHSIVVLVAEGLTNPQIGRRLFISPRTVQTHVAHVFGKLDLSSRAQLAVEVARHAPDPAGSSHS